MWPNARESDLAPPAEIKRSRLHPEDEIGEGAFGLVMRCILDPVDFAEAPIQTAAKVLLDDPNKEQLDFFFNEAIMMAMLSHPNVIGLIGVVSAGDPKSIVMEFCDNGDLQTYLQELSSRMALASTNFLLSAGVGVARGCEYLQDCEVVHRDLAARNILLDQTYCE